MTERINYSDVIIADTGRSQELTAESDTQHAPEETDTTTGEGAPAENIHDQKEAYKSEEFAQEVQNEAEEVENEAEEVESEAVEITIELEETDETEHFTEEAQEEGVGEKAQDTDIQFEHIEITPKRPGGVRQTEEGNLGREIDSLVAEMGIEIMPEVTENVSEVTGDVSKVRGDVGDNRGSHEDRTEATVDRGREKSIKDEENKENKSE